MAVEQSHYTATGLCLYSIECILYSNDCVTTVLCSNKTVAKTKLFVLSAEHLCLFKNTRSEQLEGVLI